MRWVIVILFIVGLGLIGLGRLADRDNIGQAMSGGIVPEVLGLTVLAADIVLLAGYALWRLFI